MSAEFVVSACLAGFSCRYDGSARPCAAVEALLASGRAVALCPECLGGLAVPRKPCEQRGEQVISQDGRDLSCEFMRGAQLALQEARKLGARRAILKSRSPSCGAGHVYDGSFSGRLVPGFGHFARLLLEEGIAVFSEESLPRDLL